MGVVRGGGGGGGLAGAAAAGLELGQSEDTRIILDSLNQAYPFATTQVQREVQRYLGPLNIRIVEQAIRAG